MKIVNLKKIVSMVTTLIIIATLILIIISNTTYSKSNLLYKTEYVASGETLWLIAEKESKNKLNEISLKFYK